MQWEDILAEIEPLGQQFKQSYKCMTQNRPIRNDTITKHTKLLITLFNNIRAILNRQYERYTTTHKAAANEIFFKLRDKLTRVFHRHDIHIKIPLTLSYEINSEIEETESEASDSEIENEETETYSMATNVLNLASKILPDFDGKPENLTRFIDAIGLAATFKEDHEVVLVQLVKTKLVGKARHLVTNESTLEEIIAKLKATVKGESTELITAKILNVKQNHKTTNQFVEEIDNLCSKLEGAYIREGLNSELAQKYTTQTAVKALTTNSNTEKAKIIIESGQFNNRNDAFAKFISASTNQPTGNIKYYQQERNYRRGQSHGRGYTGYNNNRASYNNNNRNNHNNLNQRGRYNQNTGRQSNSNRGNNHWRGQVRVTQNAGNAPGPQLVQLGEIEFDQ